MTDIKPSSIAQRKMFFAISRDLGYESEMIKERAKKKYGLEHFNEISSDQIRTLIDLLLIQQEKKK